MQLVEVAFKGNRKEFYAWEGDEPPPLKASVVVEADRGEDLGVVHAVGETAAKRCAGCSHGLGTSAPTRKALRIASPRDVRQAQDVRGQDDTARRKATERVKAHGLVMKLSDAEWQWDRKKLTFYFTAEKRVDFRNLVRDLAALFRARIELKQIGVRDEAKRLDGVGRCGRQYCSAGWLPELRPVNLGVAKDQHLSLNPSQISGACGRLMCCLRYEHEFYVQSRKRFPKEGRTLTMVGGEVTVVANDIFNERVTLRMADGETQMVPLAQFRRDLVATPSGSSAAVATAADGGSSPAPEAPGALEAAFGDDDDTQTTALDRDENVEGTAYSGEWPTVGLPHLRGLGPPPTTRPSAAPDRAAPPSARPAGGRAESRASLEGPRKETGGEEAAGDAALDAPLPSAAGAPRRRRGRRGGRRSRGKGGQPPPPNGPGNGPVGPEEAGEGAQGRDRGEGGEDPGRAPS